MSRMHLAAAGPAAILAVALLAGCAGGQGGPGFVSPAGGSCEALRKEMNALVARGVVANLEAQQNGRVLAPKAAAQVERYNAVLESYLGQECQNR